MAEETYNLVFNGYWRDENKDGLPKSSGVYCVYECTYDEVKKTVTIHKLIYIGEGGNVHDRVSEHEKYKYWKIHVRNGNELCFSCAAVDSDHRVRCEVAMISKHKPPVNEDYLNNFPFDKTTMSLSGETRLLHTYITVERKDN